MLILLCLLSVIGLGQGDPLVTIAQGQLRGSQQNLTDGTPYYSFKGIPYAQIPARFLAPQPPTPWDGVLSATKHGPVCVQYETSSVIGSEDCLFLNVYTKSLDKQSKLSVMVFIHGGSYDSGSGDDTIYGPKFLIQHDVILVTLNYRLEAFGFLCLDTPEVPGNAGMRDQVAALRWVKENIEQFGGNPDDVTLFGESAGASSVAFHMQSPMSKGLFQKAILQSGVSICDWAQNKGGKERALRIVNHLGSNTTNTSDALMFLQSVPASELANISYWTMTEYERNRGLPVPSLTPVVEKQFDNVEPFLNEESIDALVSGRIARVPIILGYNSDEALLFLDDTMNQIISQNPQNVLPREISDSVSAEKTEELGETLKNFYNIDQEITDSNLKAMDDMITDAFYAYSIHRFAYFYSLLADTYLYRLSLDTDLNISKNLFSKYGNITKGAAHADDVFYLFNNQITSNLLIAQPELRVIVSNLTKLWTDFAKSGNPTPDNNLGVKWIPYTPSNQIYLGISDPYTVGQNVDKDRIEFWNEIYSEAGVPSIS